MNPHFLIIFSEGILSGSTIAIRYSIFLFSKTHFEKAEAEYKKKKKELERLTKNDDDAPGEFDALLRVSKIFENFERIQKL